MGRFFIRLFFSSALDVFRSVLDSLAMEMPAECRACVRWILAELERALREELQRRQRR